MMLLEDLQRPRLVIPQSVIEQACGNSADLISVEHRWNYYLNQLALAALRPWVEEQLLEQAGPAQLQPRPLAFLQSLAKPQAVDTPLLAWLRGAAMDVADQRWIVIPTDALEAREFRIPREWVDVASLAGDYYLMVQVDPEAGQLQIRGYLSHRQLKQQADYSHSDRTFYVNDDDLIQDLDLLWVMASLETAAARRADYARVPTLSAQQARPWIAQIAQRLATALAGCQLPLAQTQPSMRLMLAFERWAGLLEDPQHHIALRQEIQKLERSQQVATASLPDTVSLQGWLLGRFEPAWRSLKHQQPAFRLNTASHPKLAQPIARSKRLTFEGLEPLMLNVAIAAAADERITVLVQLRYSAATFQVSFPTLPPGLTLRLLDATDQSRGAVTVRDQDNCIQLKRFTVRSGQSFSIQIRWGSQVLREQFQT